MQLFFIFIAALTLIYILYMLIEFLIGFNQIQDLTKQTPYANTDYPKISLIFSALNEEAEIENALTSLVNLSYPNLEIIAINDRSTDNTPWIMEKLQQQYSMLTVHHIKDLPPNWFGKNHALHVASQQAQGSWLLFTDADVTMKKDTLEQAMSYVLQRNLDHLTIYEHHRRHSVWLKVSLLGSYLTYSMVLKPWRIRHAWSKKSLGHGAFNLIKKSAYDSCEGHQTIAMECLDDLTLGALLKKNGFRQDTVDGRDYVEREWYSSLPDMINGMKKNSFAFYKYQLFPMCRDCVSALLFFMWPLFAAVYFTGWLSYLNMANVFLMLLACLYVSRQFRLEKRYAFLYPISIAILLYTMMNSALSVFKNKGVIWRGTHYPLKMLRN